MPTQAKSAAAPAKRSTKPPKPRMSLGEAMQALELAGSEQTRKTYRRHGAPEPMFGVSFATLKALLKAIGVDHELAFALWETGNFDARNLALKVADPAQMRAEDLDRWARTGATRTCTHTVAALAGEGPHAWECTRNWLAAPESAVRAIGWTAVGVLAMGDATADDAWFIERLQQIEQTIHSVSNAERQSMNQTLIALGSRNLALRRATEDAAQRIGKVDVDQGDTSCKTPDAQSYIEKAWAHSLSKGFDSPAAHERSREPLRLRC